jgi:squalene-hopene/tetraprenyl-beta-curcumene cyclase
MKPDRSQIDNCIEQALAWSRKTQTPEGFWMGDLQSNSCMEAQWVLAMHFLGLHEDSKHPKVIRAILNEQRPDGSWEVYYDAPAGDINTTVECYAALRCAGFEAGHPVLGKARRWILDHGGLTGIRVFTRYWLALLGEWPWENTPAMPPEIIFLPPWAPFNIYRFSSWARATLLPLALLSSRRPVKPLPAGRRLDELYPGGRESFDYRLPRNQRGLGWERFFFAMDRLLNRYVTAPLQPGRTTARRLCVEWIVRHQDADGVWGGIQPPFIYALMALNVEGFPVSHPVLAAGLKAFDTHWSHEKNDGRYIHASESPVWDTLLTLLAMLDCGKVPHRSESFQQALAWIMGKFLTAPGDWQMTVRGAEPGAWAFERWNTWYPDVDDTALALIVLARLKKYEQQLKHTEAMHRATSLALRWILAMQSANGGWGAFDRDNNSALVTRIPFADFGEILDPPSVDVTAHVVEALGLLGYNRRQPAVGRALAYIYSEQEEDGSWFGRWGVNYIYGTAAVLPALKAVGENMHTGRIRRAAGWVVDHQNTDGGWGESCASYMDDRYRGRGTSTASQTAWALIALVAADSHDYDDAIWRGAAWLIATQREGTWEEPQYTGTGFPGYAVGERIDLSSSGQDLAQGIELSRAFMINYNLYRHYFPIMALGRVRQHFGRRS